MKPTPDNVNHQASAASERRAGHQLNGVPSAWRWHYRTLLALRERLLQECRDLIHDAAQRVQGQALDIGDAATDDVDRDMVLGRLSSDHEALHEVERALHRIQIGRYGLCEETGEPIPAARLRAVPWARYSTDVTTRLEREGAIRRVHLGEFPIAREIWSAIPEPAEPAEAPDPLAPEEDALHPIAS